MSVALRYYRVDFVLTAAALVVAYLYQSWSAVALTAILIVVEIVFSFDNAAVNAKYLARMNHFWQRIFLTVGILIAVFGMRLVFPFVIVCLSGGVSPARAVQLALERGDPHTPGTYGYLLEQAHAPIAAFGGMFLLMLFLDFICDPQREITWLSRIEVPLQRIGKLDKLSVLLAGTVTLLSAHFLVSDPDKRGTVLFAGLLGIVVYLLVNGVSSLLEAREAQKFHELEEHHPSGAAFALAGKAAFSMFIFLEVLDASFSFDGVIGAFAITPDPVIIALGLGIGALFVRSMTVHLVRQGTLAQYEYLEHGAHWAIGALAVLLILTMRFEIPDLVIGLVGISFIAAAWFSSHRDNKARNVREKDCETEENDRGTQGNDRGARKSQAQAPSTSPRSMPVR